jgi:hypothetical protein
MAWEQNGQTEDAQGKIGQKKTESFALTGVFLVRNYLGEG